MGKRTRQSPAEIAAALQARKRQAFEAVNLAPDMADLIRNADVQITRAGEKRNEQKVEEDSARRIDGIEAIRPLLRKEGCGGCYDALRRFERDLLVRRGEGDRGRALERVDGDGGRDLADNIVAAGENVDGIEERLSRRDWWLVNEMIRPTREHDGWRGVVFYVTGETSDHAQAAAVRAAAVNLRDAYDRMEQDRTKRAA